MKVLPVPPCRHAAGVLRTFWHAEYFRTSQRHEGVRLTDARTSSSTCTTRYRHSGVLHRHEPRARRHQLLSNHTVVHSRTGLRGLRRAERKRHLLRLWITLRRTCGTF